MKTIEPSPTNEELIRAIDDLFYAAHQSALYAYWKLVERPIASSLRRSDIPDAQRYFSNGILESSLLLIRKTTEFFKPQSDSDSPDTLYAYRYIDGWSGTWLVGKDDLYAELHKRVGHITVREARYGKQAWPIFELTVPLSISGLPSSAKLRRAEYSTATRRRRSSTSMSSHYGRFLVGVTSCEAMARSNQTLQRNRSTC